MKDGEWMTDGEWIEEQGRCLRHYQEKAKYNNF